MYRKLRYCTYHRCYGQQDGGVDDQFHVYVHQSDFGTDGREQQWFQKVPDVVGRDLDFFLCEDTSLQLPCTVYIIIFYYYTVEIQPGFCFFVFFYQKFDFFFNLITDSVVISACVRQHDLNCRLSERTNIGNRKAAGDLEVKMYISFMMF